MKATDYKFFSLLCSCVSAPLCVLNTVIEPERADVWGVCFVVCLVVSLGFWLCYESKKASSQ
jgi:hypothetical protein